MKVLLGFITLLTILSSSLVAMAEPGRQGEAGEICTFPSGLHLADKGKEDRLINACVERLADEAAESLLRVVRRNPDPYRRLFASKVFCRRWPKRCGEAYFTADLYAKTGSLEVMLEGSAPAPVGLRRDLKGFLNRSFQFNWLRRRRSLRAIVDAARAGWVEGKDVFLMILNEYKSFTDQTFLLHEVNRLPEPWRQAALKHLIRLTASPLDVGDRIRSLKTGYCDDVLESYKWACEEGGAWQGMILKRASEFGITSCEEARKLIGPGRPYRTEDEYCEGFQDGVERKHEGGS